MPSQRRRKRGGVKPHPSTVPSKVELSTQQVPIPLDDIGNPRQVKIGYLWNCRKPELLPSRLSIFKPAAIYAPEYLEVVPNYDMNYTLSSGGKTTNKAETLAVSVEVSIELPSFSVSGGISFEKSDAAKFDEQEFFAQYNVQTSVVRTRSSVLDADNFEKILEPDVVRQLEDGTLDATHYISEIRFGGWATGRFTLHENMDHNLFSLAGKVGGVIPIFAGVSAGIEARIKFMTEKFNQSVSINASATAHPGPLDAGPDTLETMFRFVENCPKFIAEARPQPEEILKPVKGVPISITLSPLAHLIPKLEEEGPTYDVLDDGILEELGQAMFHLHDLSMDDPFKNALLKENPQLGIFFHSDAEKNPWTLEVLQYQQDIVRNAGSFQTEIKSLFDKYKKKLATVEELQESLSSYKKQSFAPEQLEESARSFGKEGMLLLSSVRAHQAFISGETKIFLFSEDDWDFFFTDKPGPAISLATPLSTIPKDYAQVLYKLYEITPQLKSLNVRVGVAMPNLLDDFYLESNLAVDGDIIQAPVKYRNSEDILELLKFLKMFVDFRSGLVSNYGRFLTTLSDIRGLGTVPFWTVPQLPDKFKEFQSYFASAGKVVICETSLQTRRALKRLTSEVNFLLFPQFMKNLYHSIFYWKEILYALPLEKTQTFTTIVGSVDNFPQLDNFPLMLVLDKEGEILAICYDQLDFLFVTKEIMEGTNFKSFPLTPNYMNITGFEKAVQLSAIISPFSNAAEAYSEQSSPKAFTAAEASYLESYKNAVEILSFCIFPPRKHLMNKAAEKALSFLGKVGKVINILRKSEYGVQGFPELDSAGWSDLATEIQLLIDANEIEPDDLVHILALKNAAEFAANQAVQPLKDLLSYYIQPYLDDRGDDFLSGTIMEKIQKLSADLKIQSELLELLGMLKSSEQDGGFFKLWTVMDSTLSLENNSAFLRAVEATKHFNQEEKKAVWNTKKFQNWSLLFQNSTVVLAQTLLALSSSEEDGGFPFWFPKFELRPELLKFQSLLQGPFIPWTKMALTKWENEEEMKESLGILLAIDVSVPLEFMQVLQENIERNPELKNTLKDHGLLFGWNEDENHFEETWGMEEILKVFSYFHPEVELNRKAAKQDSIATMGNTDKNLLLSTPNRTEDSLLLNTKWAKFTQDGKISKFNWQSCQQYVPLYIEKPLFIWDTEEMRKLAPEILSFLIYGVSGRRLLEWMTDEAAKEYIDYEIIQDKLEEWRNTQLANETEAMEIKEEKSEFFQKVLKTLCIGAEHDDETTISTMPLQQRESNEDKFFLSRSDYLILFLSASDEQFQTNILTQLSKSSLKSKTIFKSLPVFIPDITKDELQLVDITEALKSVPFPGAETSFFRILEPPLKALVALRVGTAELGKSTMLNEALFKAGQFSHKREPGYSNGLPLSREGLVELSWLSEETARNDFYHNHLKQYEDEFAREPIYILNVHGDFLSEGFPSLQLLEKLQNLASGFIVFWSCKNFKDLSNGSRKLNGLMQEAGIAINISVPVANFVLNPDITIAKEVPKSCILWSDHKEDYVERVQEVVGKLLRQVDAVTEGKIENQPLQEFEELLKEYSIPQLRASLFLQNGVPETEIPEAMKIIREKLLSSLTDILESSSTSVTQNLWKLHHFLSSASEKGKQLFSDKLGTVSSKKIRNPEDHFLLPFANAAIAHQRHLLASNQLQVLHLIRELLLEDKLDFAQLLSAPFYQGFLLELFNPNIFPADFSVEVLSIIKAISQTEHKFITVSLVGPQGSGKSTLLNNIFGPSFEEGSFGCTNGIVARFIKLQAPVSEGIDSILLLDSEGFSRPENFNDPLYPKMERKVGSLLLAASDMCILTGGTDVNINNNWKERFMEIFEYFVLSVCTTFAELESVRVPQLLFLKKEVKARSHGIGQGEVQTSLFAGMENVRSLLDHYTMESNLSELFVPKMVSFFSACLSPHSTFTTEEREGLLTFILSNANAKNGIWTDEIQEIWETLRTQNNPVEEHRNCRSLKDKLDRASHITEINNLVDTVYLAHEEYSEQKLRETDNLIDSFSHMKGIPYTCPILEEKECYCDEGLQRLEILEGKMPLKETEMFELEHHMASLRNDIASRISQEFHFKTLKEGEKGSYLHKLLETLLEQDPDPWVPFKQAIAALLTFPSWMGLLHKDIEEVYPFGFEGLGESPYLPTRGIWNFEKRDKVRKVPFDYFRVQKVMDWKDHVWLELELEAIVRESSFGRGGYKRGMMRGMKLKIERLLSNLRQRVRANIEHWLEPAFIKRIHFYGVKRMEDFFQADWNRWEKEANILQLLEDRKADFPHNLFLKEY